MQTNISLDATMLSMLMSCPRKMYFRHGLNLVPDRKSNSLECGSYVHFVKEYYNKARIAGKSRNDAIECGFAAGKEFMVPFVESNLYMRESDYLGLQDTPIGENDKNQWGYERIGTAFLVATMIEYFDYYRNDSFTIIGAEEVRKAVIYEDDDLKVLWKAKFDEIIDTPQGFMSCDTKTMKQRRPIRDLNVQFMGQCELLKARNIMIDKIGFQKSLKTHEKFERAVLSYSADRLAEFCNDIVPYYARMLAAYNESDVFPPNFTQCENKYGLCDYVSICEQDRNMRDEIMAIEFVKGKKWDI